MNTSDNFWIVNNLCFEVQLLSNVSGHVANEYTGDKWIVQRGHHIGLMTIVLKTAHIRIAHIVANPEVGNHKIGLRLKSQIDF